MDKKWFAMSLVKAAVACRKFAPDFTDQANLAIWYDDLKDLSQHRLGDALDFARKNLDEFPSVAWLRRYSEGNALTDEQIGVDTVRRIEEAMSLYGYTNPFGAENHIGPIGWKIVSAHGGWGNVCDLDYTQLGFVRKNWREQSTALYQKQRAFGEDYRIELPPKAAQNVAAQYLERAKDFPAISQPPTLVKPLERSKPGKLGALADSFREKVHARNS